VRPRTQVERRTEAEARLLTAAREVVSRKGWVGMTLAEVGQAAGYSRGLAAHHFGSKPKLLRALATHINDNFMHELAAAHQWQDGLDALLGFVQTYLGRKDPRWTNTRALLLLMAEALTDDSETSAVLALYNQNVLSFLTRHFESGIAAGEIRADVDPSAAGSLIVGALRGLMLQKLLKNAAVDLTAARTQLLAMMVRSFARKPSAWLARIGEETTE
jgi:AcrR family transcriptional regulator